MASVRVTIASHEQCQTKALLLANAKCIKCGVFEPRIAVNGLNGLKGLNTSRQRGTVTQHDCFVLSDRRTRHADQPGLLMHKQHALLKLWRAAMA